MISLHEYILQEKLHLNNDIKSDSFIDIDFPKVDDGELKEEIWKTFTLPNTKYVIYKDYYHFELLHFAQLADMCSMIGLQQSDFEDFDPNKDIVFYSDDFTEAFKWYINKIGLDYDALIKLGDRQKIYDKIVKFYDSKKKKPNADNTDFIADVLSGETTEETIEDAFSSYANFDGEKFPEWFKKEYF